jgi:hypothetical protein
MTTRGLRECAAIVLVVATTACSYDWTVSASSPSDSGPPEGDATVPDAAVDSSIVDAQLPDTAPPPGVDAAECAALLADVEADEFPARTGCTLGEPCTVALTLPVCGGVFYATRGTSQTLALQNAIAAFNAASCEPAISCPPPEDAGFPDCLPTELDGGGLPTPLCYEP